MEENVVEEEKNIRKEREMREKGTGKIDKE